MQLQGEWKELLECPATNRKETKTEIKFSATEGKRKREEKLQAAHVDIFFSLLRTPAMKGDGSFCSYKG